MKSCLTFLLRILCVALGLLITITVIFYPRAIATDMYSVPHFWLVILLTGMSSCYIYGLGFTPQNPILKMIFSPIISWPFIVISGYQIFI